MDGKTQIKRVAQRNLLPKTIPPTVAYNGGDSAQDRDQGTLKFGQLETVSEKVTGYTGP